MGYSAKIDNVYGNKVRLDAWELGGPERFAILSPTLWKGAHVIAVFFDITDKDRVCSYLFVFYNFKLY